ncbi:MAG TPA: beta-L-arabinofuranosidase domain-containing protein [Thermoanaerobaculia bacterium]|nr:beta-L-arabinofuranosidase domain-containing protein [Thermoanaerobaculia bacterium]
MRSPGSSRREAPSPAGRKTIAQTAGARPVATMLLAVAAMLLAVAALLSACAGGDSSRAPDLAPAPLGAVPSTAVPSTAVSLTAVPFTAVTVDDGFWAPRLERNREVTIPHVFEQNRITGRVANFERAAGLAAGPYEGRRFNDTDVYKAIEAASYSLAREPDEALEREVDALIELIAASQTEDGYLFPAYTIDPENAAPGVGTERWIHVAAGSHELYNAGHLIEAAVAHHAATGKRSLLDVAIRFADRIDADFGPDARRDIPGHEEIELALVKLADATGERRWLELARFFLDQRGREHDGEGYPAESDFAIYNDRPYKQDHLPVAEQREASGHAVRATYLYTGMADVAARQSLLEEGVPEYVEALEAIWRDVVAHKLYVTGGIGSRGTFESFGEPYELPNRTAYTESCAAIGNEMWNHRMFLRSGDPRFLDVMERTLYNSLLAGVSHAGDAFFYTNPLASEGGVERSAYFEVACCPANLARALAQLPGLVFAQRGDEVWVTLYVGSEATLEVPAGERGATKVRVRQETRYPWDGRVAITVEPERAAELALVLRMPGWARGVPVPSDLYRFSDASSPQEELSSVRVVAGGEPVSVASAANDGVVAIRRRFEPGESAANTIELELPTPVRRVVSHQAVEGNRGRVALQRGPLVYAFEEADNGAGVGERLLPGDGALEARWSEDLLGGVMAIQVTGVSGGRAGSGSSDAPLRLAVPYFAWANRGPGEMAVWVRDGSAAGNPVAASPVAGSPVDAEAEAPR